MILLLDNYDSFVYNLDRYLRRLGQETKVIRADQTSVDSVIDLNPSAIVISPGPKSPEAAGISVPLVQSCYQTTPILGVCLGHQSIGSAFGAKIVRAPRPIHGQPSTINRVGESKLLRNIPNEFIAGRYHSLIVERRSLPSDLVVTAETDDGLIMAFEHRRAHCFGVQFHPESILSDVGYQILANFLDAANITRPAILPSGDLKNG